MEKLINFVFGKKVNGVRVVPIVLKILFVFISFMLVSNFSTNFVNLFFNQAEMRKLMKELLVKDLNSLYSFSGNQYAILEHKNNKETLDIRPTMSSEQKAIMFATNRAISNNNSHEAFEVMSERALLEMKLKDDDDETYTPEKERSIFIGFQTNGEVAFQASLPSVPRVTNIADQEFLLQISSDADEGKLDGITEFRFAKEDYFGIYKYNPTWDMYFLRAEELNEFNSKSRTIMWYVSIIIIIMSILAAIVGTWLIRDIVKFIRTITSSIMQMGNKQQLGLIDLKGAPNDEITYMGMAFNAVSSTIDNLINIFQRFVSRDLAEKAYMEKLVRLEGKQQELTCLFSDIKGFTTMTEVLGTDIIKLLNLHYDKAILHITENRGVMASIIGDALLAVYGAVPLHPEENKSYLAVKSAYDITQVAADIRKMMNERKEKMLEKRGSLTKEEEKLHKAVLIEVGMGIDGGSVFYGNIGSVQHMTNTVIGDNVNSAARLEGLTRVYKVPVIISEFVKDDIEKNMPNHGMRFVKLDLVQVKGKTYGKEIYWPVFEDRIDAEFEEDLTFFSKGLEYYLEGTWGRAFTQFKKCNLAVAGEFVIRTKSKKSPPDWNGVWTMKTK